MSHEDLLLLVASVDRVADAVTVVSLSIAGATVFRALSDLIRAVVAPRCRP